jgi:molecular chaperone GrpE
MTEEQQIPESEELTNGLETEQTEKSTAESGPDPLVILIAELADQKDKYIRLFAEFDNYKKRTIKEKIDTIRNASQELIQDLLVVLDDFDRAKKLSETQENEQIFPEGMRLVYHKLLGLLQSKGLEIMDTNGKDFDPEFHEAITEIPGTDESQKGKIYDTLEKGYLLNHKIIRFAKVVVCK